MAKITIKRPKAGNNGVMDIVLPAEVEGSPREVVQIPWVGNKLGLTIQLGGKRYEITGAIRNHCPTFMALYLALRRAIDYWQSDIERKDGEQLDPEFDINVKRAELFNPPEASIEEREAPE